MQPIAKRFWTGMLAIVITMGISYLWFTLFPSDPNPELSTYFTLQQIVHGRLYSRALRIAFILGFASQCGWLYWLIFSGRGAWLSQCITNRFSGRIASGLIFFLLIWLSLQLLNLPFAFFSRFVWQHQWGFSTETAGTWFIDYIKSSSLELLLSSVGAWLLLQIIRRMPKLWWLVAAGCLSVWIVAASYLWPVIVSPMFNRFTPADDPSITSMVQRLAEKADLPVNEVLIMDASRRTTRANAYFSGVGKTRHIVLYDNLLQDYPPDEVEAVIAHEMAHWRQSHIIKGLLGGILGIFIAWGILYLVVRASLPSLATPPPYIWLFILLFFYLSSFITLPIQNGISQQMEREADSIAVMLTENDAAAVRLQVRLAVKNHSDVDPAPYLGLFSSHPSAIERITAIKSSKY